MEYKYPNMSDLTAILPHEILGNVLFEKVLLDVEATYTSRIFMFEIVWYLFPWAVLPSAVILGTGFCFVICVTGPGSGNL